jgi:hypothetical protein
MFEEIILEKIKTHISYSKNIFFENSVLSEIKLKHLTQPDMQQTTIKYGAETSEICRQDKQIRM